MKHQILENAWYGEALPSGEFAVLLPSRGVQTHKGLIPLPPEETGKGPLYIRVTNVGGFKFAGQSASLKDTSWLWDGKWTKIQNPAYGVSGLIFTQKGLLLFATPSTGAMGFRFVDESGRVWTGDQTYNDKGKPPLFEWTKHDDVVVGQADGEIAALVKYQGAIRTLFSGEARFIRFNKGGSGCAVTFCEFGKNRTHLFWFNTGEIEKLPVFAVSDPPPPPPPPVTEIPNRLPVVKKWLQFWSIVPMGADERALRVCNSVVHELGPDWGIFAGAGSGFRYKGVTYSRDLIFNKKLKAGFDILGNADNVNGKGVTALWGQKEIGKLEDWERAWHAPIPELLSVPTPGPDPDPPPPPPSPDYTALLRRVEALEKDLRAVVDAVRKDVAVLNENDTKLDSRLKSLRAKGSTSSSVLHAHSFDVPVTEG